MPLPFIRGKSRTIMGFRTTHLDHDVVGRRNQLTVGGVLDRGTINYTQNTQFGYLRQAALSSAFQYGRTGRPTQAARWWIRASTCRVLRQWERLCNDTFRRQGLERDSFRAFQPDDHSQTDILNPMAGPGSLTGDYSYNRFDPSIASPTIHFAS